ncbi:hypothetical protein U1Q18_012990 [Sarracenia purpurea var. burkii]
MINEKETFDKTNKRSKEDDPRFPGKQSNQVEQYRPKLVNQHSRQSWGNQHLQRTPLNASLEQVWALEEVFFANPPKEEWWERRKSPKPDRR